MAKKVFIDPGHGGTDSGAVGVNNLYEKHINLAVANEVAKILKQNGVEVKLSRTTDVTVSLESRTNSANAWKADCFVSIHCNAFDTNAKGVETFSYSEKTNDLAKLVQNEIIASGNYTINRGIKTANFYVLRNSNMRACLVELGFIDNIDDYKILSTKQYELAVAIAKGIAKYLNINLVVETIDPNVFYRVVAGSFNSKSLAEERQKSLYDLGYESFIEVHNKK